MHPSAMIFGDHFFKTYFDRTANITIVDIGSHDMNGSLRTVAPLESKYIGMDFVNGNGVDIVLKDAYTFPLESNSVDACVTTSCFEHSEFFWLTFTEAIRILKPGGLFYLNAPSSGMPHPWPVDCWRFYPDAAGAMKNWANRMGYNVGVIETFTDYTEENTWRDYVAVFIKNADLLDSYHNRMFK